MIDNRRNPNDVVILDVHAYEADTKHMSALQSGAVLLLLFEFCRAGELPADDDQLAHIAKMPSSKWRVYRDTIMDVAKNPHKYVHVGAVQ